MSKATILAATMLAFSVGGCQLEMHKIRMTNIAKHSNGLAVPVPEGYMHHETVGGFTLEPTEVLRNPMTFSIELTAESPAKHYSRRYFGFFGPYERRLVDSEVGSSGKSYGWWLWREERNCWLSLTATITTELTPDFLPAQAAFEQTSLSQLKGCSGND